VRRLFSLTGIILLILGGNAQSWALTIVEPVDDVTVEVNLGNDQPVHTFRVPVVSEGKRRKIIDDQVRGGEWGSTGTCPRKICSHGIWLTADALGKEEVRVRTTLTFQFEGGRKCEITKEFRLVKGKSAEYKMKCRVAEANVRLSY
jgi:hypothetical protein